MTSTDQHLREIVIAPFSGGEDEMAVIAATHLAVRLRQREDGEKTQFKTGITSSQADLTAIDEYYIEPGGNFFVATDPSADKIVGFVGLRRASPVVAELKRLAVIPEYRGRRIGSRLVSTVIDWAREEDIQKILLTTGKDEKARDLIYEPLGFTHIGFSEDLGNQHMELVLSQ